MLERNVSPEFDWLANYALTLINLDSQRKTKSSRNMSFLGIHRAQLNSHERKEDLDRVIKRQRSRAVVVEEEGAEAAEVGDMGEEAEVEAGIPVRGPSRTRTKLRGVTTTGSGVMTRRWQGQAHHPRCETVHSYAEAINTKRSGFGRSIR